MAYQYSLAHLTALGCPPPELAYVAARAGYDFFSPRLIYMGLPGEPNYALADNPEMLRQTKRAMASTGIRVHDIELARIYDDMHPTKYLPAMEVAAELGAKAVLSSVWTTNLDYATEKFAEVCDLARPFGFTVDLEFVPIAGINNLAGAAKMLRDVNRSNAGLMIDMHHFHRSHDNPEDLDRLPREWFHFAHLCDAQGEIPSDRDEFIRIMRGERLYVGEGGIDIANILKRIPSSIISIELPHLARAQEFGFAEHAFRCLESAKHYVKEHLPESLQPKLHGAA
ncbi:sugar phosphate isomerase/epimerase family protein [Propionivibrio dicarboxylicus]|uniref:Sugar phosphate isomerase/epimerase n=1 Tax=Propionivibrio dicarboxylicus TaxID=83767 RepID=A0A1G8HTR1_9RHOO|nr:TIM barrel protein [Propionivibrio dicarboxylicus]SDI09932.1 Sugar phosphate isomerase/epimerase [Propionivibrio dicarboxylicus]